MESAAGEPHASVSLVTGLLPIVTAVGGALWGPYAYFDHQHEAQEAPPGRRRTTVKHG